MKERKYRALILNDYEHARYAEMVKTGKKSIETRMKKMFSFRGDVVICCGKSNSVGPNAGKALCIVELYDARPMRDDLLEIEAAGIGWDPDRKSHLLRNWRHFSRDFEFAPQATKKNFQGLFELVIPDDVEIIPKPEIKAFYPYLLEFEFAPAGPTDIFEGRDMNIGRIPFDNRIDAGGPPEDF